jgi:hypothetical protein
MWAIRKTSSLDCRAQHLAHRILHVLGWIERTVFLMSSAPSNSEARILRPSQVIAEALVDRQDPDQLVHRARQLGFSRSLTTAVVAACCKGKEEAPRAWPFADFSSTNSAPQS